MNSYAGEFNQAALFRLTSGLIGLQFCWAVQVGYVTKSLLELGVSQRFVSYAWLAGPIAGIFVQPTVGAISDRCTSSLGRRRPFLIGGTLFSVLCLFLFAYAEDIGRYLGDDLDATPKHNALVVAIFAFWALDFSINAAQGPLRALLADVVPPHQHREGNAYFALATGIGNCCGSFLGSLRLSAFLPWFRTDLHALFSAAAVALLFFMGCTVVSTKEIPISNNDQDSIDQSNPVSASISETGYESTNPPPPSSNTNSQSSFPFFSRSSFLDITLHAPPPFWSTFCVQCFTWFGWFTLFVFGTSWVGAEVMNGSFTSPEGTPSRDIYDTGVRLGNFGLALQSIVTIIFSPLLPFLIRSMNAQTVYILANVTLAIALGCALVLHHASQAWVAVGAIASTGFAWAVTMTIPWSLMGEAVVKLDPAKAGIYYTLFNLSQCFPEVLVSIVAEQVVGVTGKQAAVLILGAISTLIGAALIVVLQVGKEAPKHSDEERELRSSLTEDVEMQEGVGRSL